MTPSQNPADYSIVLTMAGYPELARAAIVLHDKLIADGRPEQASRVRRALLQLRTDLLDVAKKTAVDAHASIRSAELQSRVRPDSGGAGGPRLNDFIGVSVGFDPVPGSVLINSEPTLKDNGVGWWWTNEEGYRGHIGRRFIGSFEGTRPDPSRFREHAVLDMRKGAKNRAKGTIKKPIPERRFVRDGAGQAEARWHAQIQAAQGKYVSAIRLAVRTTQQPQRRRRRP
jgi:hypothetical protein